MFVDNFLGFYFEIKEIMLNFAKSFFKDKRNFYNQLIIK